VKTILLIAALVIVLIAAAGMFVRIRSENRNAELAAELIEGAESETRRKQSYSQDDLADLPQPVRQYLSRVLTEGQPHVRSVRLEQVGQFRLGEADSPWKPLNATQTFSVDPPGFVWNARIRIVPLLSVRVLDKYWRGQGALRARLLSVIPIVDQGPNKEMNAGELLRYLAEAVWFPTAFLPGEGVEWEPIGESSARATLSHGDTEVSLIFHFNERDEVIRVTSESRYRNVDGSLEPTPWSGYFRNYQNRSGMLIPLDGEVEWNLQEGNLPYWRGHVTEIEHRY
jgi:hypothetical protein